MHQHLNGAVRMVAGCVLALTVSGVCAQQPFPNKTIRIIVPLVPGGSTNNLARIISEKLRDGLGQPVIVENRPGGNSVVGSEAVARAAPDGYTLLVNSSTHTIIPFVEPKLPYDTLKDFAAVAALSRTRYMMLVHPSLPAKTVKEFIAFAKPRPGQINFASSGSASGSRLAGEVFNMVAGVRMQNIPYKGGAQAVTDLIGGHVHVSFNSPNLSAPYVNSGRLRGLAIAGENRLALMPDVPTFAQAGLPAWNELAWYGLFAPADTPRAVVDRLSSEIARIQAAADVRDVLDKQGLESFVTTPEQFATFLRTETAKIAKLVKSANLKFDQP
jgi:tripartite-type tricarboxylate transporter receptor subunit TctC